MVFRFIQLLKMRSIVLIIACIFLNVSIVRSQETIKKTVIDAETGMPVSGAHVYKADHLKTGTVTNRNGWFVLKRINKNDTIKISHISYIPLVVAVINIKSDTIRLSKISIKLDEILVYDLSGKGIVEKVIDSLPVNHFVEPVMYEVYMRVLEFEQDYSELHVLSEYLMDVYQNQKNNSEFHIVKTRAKPFSNAGKKYFKDMRMILAIAIYTDNIFKYQNDIFKKKKLKNYDIEIVDEISYGDYNLVKLICSPNNKKVNDSFVLFVDRPSFAVQKMIKYYSESKEEFNEIGFKQINDKWYLDYSKRIMSTTFYSKWQPGSKSTVERVVIYNINERVKYDDTEFKTVSDIMAEPIKWYIGDWSDNFWESYNYVPLPDWIREKITNSNAQSSRRP